MKPSFIRSAARRLVRPTLLLAFTAIAGCSDKLTAGSGNPGTPSNPANETYAAALGITLSEFTKKSDALYVKDLTVGTGAEAINGRTLGVTYTGWLVNGTKFDSNVGGNTFSFLLGAGQVIAGWDQGVAGMKVGGKRRLILGSTLGYGGQGAGIIPPNSTLVFDVELKTLQ